MRCVDNAGEIHNWDRGQWEGRIQTRDKSCQSILSLCIDECVIHTVYVTRKLRVHCTCYWVNFLPSASVGQTSGPDHTGNPLNYLWGTASHICHRDGPHCQICTSANGALNQAKHVHFECVWWLIYIYELLLLVLSQKETRARPHPKPINYVRGTATHICCYCQTCSCAETNLWAIDLSNDPPLSHQILLVTHSEPSYRW